MSKKTIRIITLIIIILLLLAAVAYFLFMYKFPGAVIANPINKPVTTQVKNTGQIPVAATSTREVAAKTKAEPASDDAIAQAGLVKIAEAFAERLGSYSNQSNFSNLNDLKVEMTASMQAWAVKYIAANQKIAYSGYYQGVTTNAVSAAINNFDAAKGQAEVLVHTQKVSVNGTSSPVTANQDITITFVKQTNGWLVDNAVWKK